MTHVVEHLQELQRELSYLVDEGAEDAALGRVVEALPHMNSLRALQLSVDHMRYFLWCLMEFVPEQQEERDQHGKMRSGSLPAHLDLLSDAELLSLFCDGKTRKPN